MVESRQLLSNNVGFQLDRVGVRLDLRPETDPQNQVGFGSIWVESKYTAGDVQDKVEQPHKAGAFG